MKCLKCGKENKEKYCNSCFLTIIKKRVRKHQRMNKIIKPKDNIVIKDDITKWLVKECVNFPIEISKKGKELLPITLDMEIHDFLKSMFSSKFVMPKEKISLLTPLTNDEIKRLCKLKKLKFNFPKEDDVYKLINKIEKKYPGKKFSLYNSMKSLR